MTTQTDFRKPREAESGFALVLAILTLLLLTFLGLTMAVTTSTELQIARNYQWSQQALYNAEAGLEIGKTILRTATWTQVLPAARTGVTWDGQTLPTQSASAQVPAATTQYNRVDAWGNVSRNFENWQLDYRSNGVGYGAVLDTGPTDANAPYQYVTSYTQNGVTTTLNGAVTLWVRRLATPIPASGLFQDFTDTNDDTLILVSEGVAPFTGGLATSALGRSQRATAVLEVTTSKITQPDCGTNSGQVGSSALGGGFSDCPPLPANATQNIGNSSGTGSPGAVTRTQP